MARKQPWLDYKGSLELVRQAKLEHERKLVLKSHRQFSTALFFLFILGHYRVHRIYLYDSEGAWSIFKITIILVVICIPLSFYLGEIYSSMAFAIYWLGLIIFSIPKLKRNVKSINDEVNSYD